MQPSSKHMNNTFNYTPFHVRINMHIGTGVLVLFIKSIYILSYLMKQMDQFSIYKISIIQREDFEIRNTRQFLHTLMSIKLCSTNLNQHA